MKLLRSLFGLFVIAAALYCGWKVLPPYIANYQLEDTMDSTARMGAVDRVRTEEELRETIVKEARSLKIALDPEAVQVQRVSGDVLIWAEYDVHVDMAAYPFDLHFKAMSKSKRRSM